MIELTPKQIDAIHIRITATCTDIRIERTSSTVRARDISFFNRQRLIETVRIQPGGGVMVLS